MIYFQLFFEFFKTGLFSIGGGLATLPFLYDIAEKTNWYTSSDLADMIAISESTPGSIGGNMATAVGFNVAGIPGAIVSNIGLICPSIIIIVIIAQFLKKFKENKLIDNIFYGLRPASTALIAAAGYSVLKISILAFDKYNITKKILDIFNFKGLILAIILFILINKYKKHPVVYIAASAVIGIIFKFS